MKRNPGEWLREQLLDRVLNVAMSAVIGVSWLCGASAALWMAYRWQIWYEWNSLIVLMPGVFFLVFSLFKAKRGWRMRHMKIGARAEETIGQAIEYALIRDSCAVAHHVETIAKVGDIDHLVATPQRLWVIETKNRRVHESKFPETLRRITRNVEEVRKWAPEVQVTGCLAFANFERTKPTATYNQETILCFSSPRSLVRALREDARRNLDSPRLARRVWELAKVENAGDQSVSNV